MGCSICGPDVRLIGWPLTNESPTTMAPASGSRIAALPGVCPGRERETGRPGRARKAGSLPRLCPPCGPCSHCARPDGVHHPAEHARPPRTAEDLAQGDLVPLLPLHVRQLPGGAQDRSTKGLGEEGRGTRMVHVAVREQQGEGVRGFQAQVAERCKDVPAVIGIATVNEDVPRPVPDHGPVRGRPFSEIDAGCLPGDAGCGIPPGGLLLHGYSVARREPRKRLPDRPHRGT